MDINELRNKMESTSDIVDPNRLDKLLDQSIANAKDRIVEPMGSTYNLMIAMEELGELTQAISKYIRSDKEHNENARYKVIEEYADVYIMLHYIEKICDIDFKDVAKAINVKLDRLNSRLDDEDIDR